MPTSAVLKKILKENHIRGYSHYTNSKLIDMLVKRELISENMILINKSKKKKDIDPKFSKADTHQSKEGWDTWSRNRWCWSLSFYIQGCFGLG